jgi:hypothetical protein
MTSAQDWSTYNLQIPSTQEPSVVPKATLLKSVLGLQDVAQGQQGVLMVRAVICAFCGLSRTRRTGQRTTWWLRPP